MSSNVAFVIGAGSNVGTAIASQLKSKGYAVAIGSRNPDVEKAKAEGFFAVKVDTEKIETVQAAFEAIKAELGEPNVVIYNVGTIHPAPSKDPLQLSVEDWVSSTASGTALYAAAHAAMPGFRAPQHKNSRKVFITTGNALPFSKPSDVVWMTGNRAQKVTHCHLIELFHDCYKEEGIRFHYAALTEVDLDAWYTPAVGTLHSEVYWDLITRETPASWKYVFNVDGKVMADNYHVPQEWANAVNAMAPM